MSEDLKMRHEHVAQKLDRLLLGLDDTLQELYLALLESDPDDGLDEERSTARLEGFHDYIVVKQISGVDRPNFNDFLKVRESHPETLLSFSTGRRRADDGFVDDSETPVTDEEMASYDSEDQDETLVAVESVLVVSQDSPAVDAEREIDVVLPTQMVWPTKASGVMGSTSDDSDESATYGIAQSLYSNSASIEFVTDDPAESASKESSDEAQEPFISVWQDEDDSLDVAPTEEPAATTGEPSTGEPSTGEPSTGEPSTPGRLDAKAVEVKEFGYKRGGYNCDQVDDILDTVVVFLKKDHPADEYGRMIDLLKNIQFKTTTLAKGFNPIEVDGFIEAIIGELMNRSSVS